MLLHENREAFSALIANASQYTGRESAIIEKDYYITLILHRLANTYNNCVFKGGTSLSKGFHIINRFSEDVDITFEEHIGKQRRKKLKHETMKAISEELALPIDNWDDIESNKDLNSYCFQYCSVLEKDSSILSGAIPEYVKVETSLGSCAFPTTTQPIGSYIDDYLKARERPDLIKQFQLEEFPMKLQAIERTYIDKIFASCDYYLNGQSNKRSRHLYDIYKLAPFVSFDAAFFRLFAKVRQHRREMNEREQRKGKKQICPSAEPDISLSHVIRSYCSDAFFEQDYYETTKHFIYEYVEYEDIIDQILKIADQLENIV